MQTYALVGDLACGDGIEVELARDGDEDGVVGLEARGEVAHKPGLREGGEADGVVGASLKLQAILANRHLHRRRGGGGGGKSDRWGLVQGAEGKKKGFFKKWR